MEKTVLWTSEYNEEDWLDDLAEAEIAPGTAAASEYITDCIGLDFEELCLDPAFSREFPEQLVIFGEAGRWYGVSKGIACVNKKCLEDCIQPEDDWISYDIYLEDGELKLCGYHHDGRDYYTIRKWINEEIREETLLKLDYGEILPKEVIEHTLPLGDYIEKEYLHVQDS